MSIENHIENGIENGIFLNQDCYYDNIIQNKIPVNVFLINGVKLYGTIEGYDSHTITLSGNKGNNTVQLVYKHAISTIQIYNQI